MKKAFLLFTLFLFAATSAVALDNVTLISSDELKKMQDDQASFILVDARGDKQFAENHIAGAVNLPADQVSSESLTKIAPDIKTKLVFYCQDVGCNASHIASQKALGAGYQYVYRYPNGIEDWTAHGYPVANAK